ncbi:MAG: anion permease [Athalassotoga sp.]|uniref:inorganic phosphate transporter n=3 Tax=Athalassotoga sp. TaxID=2022597 RepID=UPI00269F3B6E
MIFVIILASALVGWSLGRNNIATLFGPSVVSGVMNYRIATVVAGIFVLAGSIVHGSAGLSTVNSITKVSLDISLSASIGTAILIILMTHFSIPTSITQGIVGSLVGLGMINGYVNWNIVLKVAIFWAMAPFGAIVISFISHKLLSIQFNKIRSLRKRQTILQIMTLLFGIYASYSLGANNVANVVGPFVGKGMLNTPQALLIGGSVMAFGSLMSSKKVIYSVGKNITSMEPFDASIAVFAESTTLFVYSLLGIPTSSVQSSIGSTIGVGFVKGLKTMNFKGISRMITGWIITPFLTALISIVIYIFLKAIV